MWLREKGCYSGMSSLEQLENNAGYMEDFRPFNEEERELGKKAADLINEATAVPCTGRSYCTDGCPSKIAIPQYFFLYEVLFFLAVKLNSL